MQPLSRRFFQRDAVRVARDLLGRLLVSEKEGLRTVGRIVETEGYAGPGDRAAHVAGVMNAGSPMERVEEHLAVWSNVRKPWFVRHALKEVDLGVEFWRQEPTEVGVGVQVLQGNRWRDRLPVAAKAREGLLDEG